MINKSDTLMVQGTTSDAGKSTLVAGIGRVLQRRGVRVAPFKPQNMALNSAVTADGGEIGRAQAVQAQACRVETTVHMNPILIKPSSDTGAQVIVHGQSIGNFEATGFHNYKPRAMAAVLESYEILRASYECILVEGAGSPAEINLREGDIANMGFAEEVDCPVVLVTDIDRGGSFAHLVGTLALLSETEQQRVRGFFINRFRGDIALLQPGVDWLEERTGIPVLGVIPYIPQFHLEAEDAITTEQITTDAAINICVPVLPRISNHTDFDPLRMHAQVNLQYVAPGADIPACDLIILPGSKSVRDDLQTLKDAGWDKAIIKHLRYGGRVLGICGGYQMLGKTIADPHGVEGAVGTSEGLGLLDCTTELTKAKALRNVRGKLRNDGSSLTGYEIHMGVTTTAVDAKPFAVLTEAAIYNETGNAIDSAVHNTIDDSIDDASNERFDGVCSDDDQIRATYVHGVFNDPSCLSALLHWAGLDHIKVQPDYETLRDREIDRLADTIEAHTDMEKLYALLTVSI